MSSLNLKNSFMGCHRSIVNVCVSVFMQSSKYFVKNHPVVSPPFDWADISSLSQTSSTYPPARHPHLTQPHQTTQDQTSVREWPAIDMKCVTKCRNGAPQTQIHTHIASGTQTSQAEAAVNSWHANQDQNRGQLFSKGTSPDRKTSPGV